jgi:hypothetical protein
MPRHRAPEYTKAMLGALMFLALSLGQSIVAQDSHEGGQASPRAIVKGPYLQNLSSGNITICWSTDSLAGSAVYYSKDLSFGLSAVDSTPATLHEMQLTGLDANTTYNYYVVSGAFQSPTSTFRTAPEGRMSFRFGVHGDTRTNDQNHSHIISLMHSYDPEFYLNCGDLVEVGAQQSLWDEFFNIISPYSNDTAYYPCIGNHDTPPAYYKLYFSLPNNEEYYSFDYGFAHFIALDTTGDYSVGSAQYNWLGMDLDSAFGADWIFVFFHHPPYSSGSHGSTLSVRNTLDPVFAEHNVTVVFSGHDHDYEHADPGDGIQYFVSGGGGAPLNAVGHNAWTVYSEMVYQFMTVDVGCQNITLTAIRENDTVMETVRIPLRDRTAPAPVPLRAQDTGIGGQVALNWSAYDEKAQGDVAQYRLFYSTSNFTDVTGLHANLTLSAGTFSTIISGLSNGTPYYFAVVAADEVPNIDPRVRAVSAAPTDRTPPAPPAGLRVTGFSHDYIDLAWNFSREPDLDGYRVWANDSGAGPAGPYHNITPLIKRANHRAEGLAMNTTYCFVVAAVDKASPVPNNSTFSTAVTCTTPIFIPNRPPEAHLPLPSPVMDEDSKRPVYVAFSSVFSDPDGDELSFSLGESFGARAVMMANGSGVELLPLPDWNGRGYFVVSANDSQFETSANITVTINPVNDLPLLLSIQDEWVFTEDAVVSYEFVAQDSADRDSNITASTELPSAVSGLRLGLNWWLNRTKESDGEVHFTVSMIADNGMVGTFSCNVSVSDSQGGITTVQVAVRILNVNDPPSVRITGPAEGQAFEHNQTINLTAEAFDDDLPHGDVLRFEWRADGSTVLGTRQNLTGISLPPGNHTITLTVKDSSNAGARAAVNITIKEKPTVLPPPPQPSPPPVKSSGVQWTALMMASVAAAVIAAVALSTVLLFRRKR